MKAVTLTNLFYRSPRLLVLTLLLIATAGAAGLALLPRSEDPILAQRNAPVFTALPGADDVVRAPPRPALHRFARFARRDPRQP